MNEAKIQHLRYAPVIGRFHLLDRRKDADHGIVDPDVDWPEVLFDLAGRSVHRIIVGDIGGDDYGLATQRLALCLARV